MRIVCPTCSAAYEVPDRMLGSGKKLRCARCANEWVPPEVPVAAPAPPPAPVAPERPTPAAPPPPRPVQAAPAAPAPALHADPKPARSALSASNRLAVPLALAGSAMLLAALLGAGVIWRSDLMHAWPPTARLFGWLGLG